VLASATCCIHTSCCMMEVEGGRHGFVAAKERANELLKAGEIEVAIDCYRGLVDEIASTKRNLCLLVHAFSRATLELPNEGSLPVAIASTLCRMLTGLQCGALSPQPSLSAVCLSNMSLALLKCGQAEESYEAAVNSQQHCPWYWKGYLRASRAAVKLGPERARGPQLRQRDFADLVAPITGLLVSKFMSRAEYAGAVETARQQQFLRSCRWVNVSTFNVHASLVPLHNGQWVMVDVTAVVRKPTGAATTERLRCFALAQIRSSGADALIALADLDYEQLLNQSNSVVDLEVLQDARTIVESVFDKILTECPNAAIDLVTLGQGLYPLVDEFDNLLAVRTEENQKWPLTHLRTQQGGPPSFHADAGYLMRSIQYES